MHAFPRTIGDLPPFTVIMHTFPYDRLTSETAAGDHAIRNRMITQLVLPAQAEAGGHRA